MTPSPPEPSCAKRSASAVNSRLWQLASLVLIEPLAHVRGGGCISVKLRRVAARDNSRLGVLVPSGDRSGPTEPAGETLASLVLIEPLAHVRGGGCISVKSRRVAARGDSRLGVLVPSGDRSGPTEPTGETLASLVLIEPLAHVRGPVPGLSIRGAWPRGAIRANGRRLNAAPVQAVGTRPRRRRVQVSSRIFEEESWRVTGRSAARLRGAGSSCQRIYGRCSGSVPSAF